MVYFRSIEIQIQKMVYPFLVLQATGSPHATLLRCQRSQRMQLMAATFVDLRVAINLASLRADGTWRR